MHLQNLIPTLQLATGPVILISGIGLILLSMTNRMGRIIDRTWELARECRILGAAERRRASWQMTILMRRARIIRAAIAGASVSVLFAALLVLVLFLGALLRLPLTELLVGGLFVGCVTSLIAALILFIADVNVSLHALKVEIDAAIATPEDALASPSH